MGGGSRGGGSLVESTMRPVLVAVHGVGRDDVPEGLVEVTGELTLAVTDKKPRLCAVPVELHQHVACLTGGGSVR